MPHVFNARRLVVLLTAFCLVLLFAAQSVARPTAADPTTADMTIASSDLPDSPKVSKQRYVKAVAPATSTYGGES